MVVQKGSAEAEMVAARHQFNSEIKSQDQLQPLGEA